MENKREEKRMNSKKEVEKTVEIFIEFFFFLTPKSFSDKGFQVWTLLGKRERERERAHSITALNRKHGS